MPEHNRQVNVHLIGEPVEGLVEKLVAKLDCNIDTSTDVRQRLTWLTWNANLVILLPRWNANSRGVMELAVAKELGLEFKRLSDVLGVSKPAPSIWDELVDFLHHHGVEVNVRVG